MLISLAFLQAVAANTLMPTVPGNCTAPAAENADAAGCYLLSEFQIENAPRSLFWHIVEFDTKETADKEAQLHRWARVVFAHSRIWLLYMGQRAERSSAGSLRASIGPLRVPPGGAASIRFLVSDFPPGIRTRVHSHPGVEAFFVVAGEQCVETPDAHKRIGASQSYIVKGGLHMQAAPDGRRSLVALVLAPGVSWSTPTAEWTPSGFCNR